MLVNCCTVILNHFYPSCASNADLANNFINFFGTKFSKIRNDIESHSVQQSMQLLTHHCLGQDFVNSSVLSIRCFWILLIIWHQRGELDPIPSRPLLDCADLLGPIIMRIVNLSLASSFMPPTLKQALTRPLLKKTES